MAPTWVLAVACVLGYVATGFLLGAALLYSMNYHLRRHGGVRPPAPKAQYAGGGYQPRPEEAPDRQVRCWCEKRADVYGEGCWGPWDILVVLGWLCPIAWPVCTALLLAWVPIYLVGRLFVAWGRFYAWMERAGRDMGAVANERTDGTVVRRPDLGRDWRLALTGAALLSLAMFGFFMACSKGWALTDPPKFLVVGIAAPAGCMLLFCWRVLR